MSTAALREVWNGLIAYNLTTENKRWLAQQLWEQAERETQLRPYTMAELNARIDRAEADIAAGRIYSRAEMSKIMSDFVAQYE